MKRRATSFLLTLIMLFSIVGSAFAVEPRASYYLDDYYVSLTADGDGKMIISAIVNGVGKQDKIGIQEIIIQQKVNGSWTHYDILDATEHPEFYEYNSYEYVNEITFTGTPGVTYRVLLTVYAKKGSGSDTGYLTSFGEVCK